MVAGGVRAPPDSLGLIATQALDQTHSGNRLGISMWESDRTRKCRFYAISNRYCSKIRWICKANSPVWLQSLTVIGWTILPVTFIENRFHTICCVPKSHHSINLGGFPKMPSRYALCSAQDKRNLESDVCTPMTRSLDLRSI